MLVSSSLVFHVSFANTQALSNTATNSPAVLAVIEHSSRLFACDLNGSRVTIPYFLPHLQCILADAAFPGELRYVTRCTQ